MALAPLREPALLLPGIVQALELKEQPGRPLAETLQAALMGRRMLLFLDNAEHLLPDLVTELAPLRAIAGPSIFVTSRERLQLQGEHVYQVPSLNTEDAVDLFLTRAAQQGVSLSRTTAVSELCRRLDELPLALELAAARTPLFSPEQLLERLAQRLDLLKGGRDADPRQQTLRATIQWSYGLLADEEQRLFRQLSVFLGGCTFEAAEEICDAEPDTLQSLLDKSLLRRRDSSAGHRYWMLETIRDFAGEGLDGSGEAEEVARRHAGWYSRLGIDLYRALRHRHSKAVARLDDELANMRAGLAHALERRDVALAGDFLWALWYPWLTRGHGAEAASAAGAWLALDRSALEPLARIPGLLAAGEIIRFTGEHGRAATLKRELLASTRENPGAVVHGWNLRTMLPALLTDLASIELDEGRLDQAEACAKEALDLRHAEGAAAGIAHAQMAMFEISYARRDFAGARTILVEAFAGWQKDEQQVEAAKVQAMIAECDVLLGELESAETRLAQWLPLIGGGDLQTSANVVEVAAVLAAARGEMERASRLAGAAERLGSNSGVIWRSPYEAEVRGEILGRARDAVGEDAYRRAFTEGEALDEPDALKLVAETAVT